METGQIWNGWTIEKYLGEGSFGKVYKIGKEEFGNRYESALKVIRIPQNAGQLAAVKNEGMDDEGVRSYFYSVVQSITTEFALMSELSGNSNIVSYEDHTVSELTDEFGWDIYLRMELVTPLYEHIAGRVLTAEDIVKMGIDISKAIETCQKNNVIHRDIKPDNIFYSRQGTYKLGDFGIARKLEKMDAGMTKVGTFSFMAPEVYKGQPYDATVDIYSLGLILYQFLNDNRRPFFPPYPEPILYADNEDANLKRMMGEPMPAPQNAGSRLSEVVLKACAYDPKERYQDASQMKTDLEEILRTEDLGGTVFPFRGATPEDIKRQENSNHYTDETVTMFEETGFTESRMRVLSGKQSDVKSSSGQTIAGTKSGMTYNEKAAAPAENTIKKKTFVKIVLASILVVILATGAYAYTYFNHSVPDVKDVPSKEAEILIRDAGLSYEETEPEFSDKVERGNVVKQSVAAGKSVKKGTKITVTLSRGTAIECPDLTGLTYSKAEKKAEKLKLVIDEDKKKDSVYSDDVPKGSIVSQSIDPGTDCEEGEVIYVVKSRRIEQVAVPGVSGKSQQDAEAVLKDARLTAQIVTQYNGSVTKGFVSGQSPKQGEKVDKNSPVIIYVSLGARPVSSSGNTKNSSGSSSKKKTTTKHAKGKKL